MPILPTGDPTGYPLTYKAYKLTFADVTDGLSATVGAGEGWHGLRGFTTLSSGTKWANVRGRRPAEYPAGSTTVNSVGTSAGTPAASSGYTSWGANGRATSTTG